MNTINLGAASWTLARAQLRLEVAASALLDAHDLALKDPEDLRRNDTWIDKGHNFHFSFHISFNGLPSSFGALNADTGSDFIALALTQAPFWSQLHLVASIPAQDAVTDSCRVENGTLPLKLERDPSSDFDLSNVKPPNAISALSLASVQISLKFSSIPVAPKKSHRASEGLSPRFEDLLGLHQNDHISDLDLEIPKWQDEEDRGFDDGEGMLDLLRCHAIPQLPDNDSLESPKDFMCSVSALSCLPGSNLHSLETRPLIFSSQASKIPCHFEEDMPSSKKQSTFQARGTATGRASGPMPTFEPIELLHSFEPGSSSSIRSSERDTDVSHSSTPVCNSVLRQDTATICKPILSLTDAALRTLIHPQPTRLSAGIRPSRSDSCSKFFPSQDTPNAIYLSELAPSIFTPEYAQAVVRRAQFVPSLAKSLARFLRYRSGSGADESGSAEHQRGLGEVEEEIQEDLKDILRGHLWMTMTNGLRISHSQKARRLRPLTMPLEWREEDNEKETARIEQEDMEMLDEIAVPGVFSQVEEGDDAEDEARILRVLERRGCCGHGCEIEEELLFDEEEVDLSFLEEGFEELRLFPRVDNSDVHAVLKECTEADNATDEMLF